MVDYKEQDKGVDKWLVELARAQDAEHDQRESARACDAFINQDDGMWEPNVITNLAGRPRYTFDFITPLMDQIIGEMDKNVFTLKTTPASSKASARTAALVDGLVRHVRNISNFDIWSSIGRQQFLERGIFAYEIVADYQNPMSFDQDIMIKPILGAEDRVFFDPNSKLPDRSDAEFVHILDELTVEAYKKKWPEGSCRSVGSDREAPIKDKDLDFITVGRRIWKKKVKKTIVKMSDGSVYEKDDKFAKTKDDMAMAGITVVDEREVEEIQICSRMYDGAGYLGKEEKTVFNRLPVVPLYCNFKISDGKILYSSFIKRLMDFNRVFNYSKSREIEEGALAPRRKMWGTPEQRLGHDDTIETLNTNSDAWQDYNHIEGQPPPYETGGAQINPGLQVIGMDMQAGLKASAGMFDSNMGDNPGFQSGVAVNSMIDRGNNGTSKHFEALKMCYTAIGKVITGAMGKIYDATRTVRILGEDGSAEITTINRPVVDQMTGQVIYMNDLTAGEYDVICDIGPAFKNRQDEGTKMFTEAAKVYPEIMQLGGDIFLSNLSQPGMDKVAKRARLMQIKSGVVPEAEMSDEELAMYQKEQEAAKNKGPSPDELALQVQKIEAETAMLVQQNKQVENQIKMQQLEVDAVGKREKIQSDMATSGAKIEQEQQRIDMAAEQQRFMQQMEQMRLELERQKLEVQDYFNSEKIKLEEEKVKVQKVQIAHAAMLADDNTEYSRNQEREAKEADKKKEQVANKKEK